MYLKLAFVLFVFTFKNVESQLSTLPKCVEQGTKVETLLRDLLFITERFSSFETKEDLNYYCIEANNLIKESKEFKKRNCLTKLAQQVFNTIIPRFRAFVVLRCKQETDLTLRLVKCTTEKNRKPIKKCFLDYSNIIKYTANKVKDSSKMLSLLCCNYHRVMKCLASKEFQDCEDIKSGKFALETADNFLRDLFSFLCFKSSLETCEQDGYMRELDKIGRNQGSVDEFIIIPALRIADKLGD